MKQFNETINPIESKIHHPDFFEYWDALGFFDNIQMILPKEFFLLFEIARHIESGGNEARVRNAIEELLKKDPSRAYDREKSILINRMDKNAPISEKMEIRHFKTIYELKKAIPRDLIWGRRILNIKLFTKTLLVQKYFESEGDKFKPISQALDETGRNRSRFDQKFYLLMDRSRSMDKRMRSFYSKSIVVEYLRRKLESNAKLFYRAFDSKPGSLVKVEKKEDFPALIEKVIFTTTGGTSTNMQEAVFQAIRDINYDKEMTDAEILVVTDGLVHDLNIDRMKEELKDIKLNFLKIGLDLAEPNGYEIKRVLTEEGYQFDPFAVSMKEIKKKLEKAGGTNPLSRVEQRIYEFMLECSEKIIEDMKGISHKFIEIDDIKPDDLISLNKDSAAFVESNVKELLNIDLTDKTVQESAVIYKKVYFLSQYIEFLLKSGSMSNDPLLKKAMGELLKLKQKLLSDPSLLSLVMRTGVFEADGKAIKEAKKSARKKLKEIASEERTLTKDDMKNAKVIFAMSGGKGSGNIGQFFIFLFYKLLQMVKLLYHKIKRSGNGRIA